ncbi:hypothetical protein [uncultured Cohaesibacter sp.]|uniref:hypothetical protein n=1 Tax=uncultured Cohaesibacter sp. TaxID=1002546 RepID=UPI0029C93243|nr:hypothetical protein [uncultured Cohaesibacter sp.]
MTARAVIAAKPQPLLAREWLTAWIWGPTPFRVFAPSRPSAGGRNKALFPIMS